MPDKTPAVRGSAEMWALSTDKQTVRLILPPGGPAAAGPLSVEFDRNSLEATLSMLVQMHFEMMRTTPAEVPYIKH